MAEAALAALYRAVRTRAIATSEMWGNQAFADIAPAKTARPYVVFNWAGGGEVNGRVAQDAEIVIAIKAVAESMADALTMAGRISALFNDADANGSNEMDGGADWVIVNSQQEGIVHLVESVDGRQIYHEGHRFRFYMNR